MGISKVFHFKEYSDKAWIMSLQPYLPPRAVSLLHLSLSLRGSGSVIQVVDLKTLGRAGSCVEDASRILVTEFRSLS